MNGDVGKLPSGAVYSSTPESSTSATANAGSVSVGECSSNNSSSSICVTGNMVNGVGSMAVSPGEIINETVTCVGGYIGAPTMDPISAQTTTMQPSINEHSHSIPLDQLKQMLLSQLEYYFSRENLANDTYLLSQMDNDQYVPIWTVANFNQVKKLTKDINLITEVLRESPNVQVDEEGIKVRPNHKRCIVILREIPDNTPIEDVKNLFSGENCPRLISCEFAHNNSWYVTFETDDDAQRAYQFLREEVREFQGKPIMARIKAKPMHMRMSTPLAPAVGSVKNGYRTTPPQAAAPYDPTTATAAAVVGGYPPNPQRFVFNGTPPPQYSNQMHLYQYYAPNMIQAWPATATGPFYDIGSVFAVNGLSPQGPFKQPQTRYAPRPRNKQRNSIPSTAPPAHQQQMPSAVSINQTNDINSSAAAAAVAAACVAATRTHQQHMPPPSSPQQSSSGGGGSRSGGHNRISSGPGIHMTQQQHHHHHHHSHNQHHQQHHQSHSSGGSSNISSISATPTIDSTVGVTSTDTVNAAGGTAGSYTSTNGSTSNSSPGGIIRSDNDTSDCSLSYRAMQNSTVSNNTGAILTQQQSAVVIKDPPPRHRPRRRREDDLPPSPLPIQHSSTLSSSLSSSTRDQHTNNSRNNGNVAGSGTGGNSGSSGNNGNSSSSHFDLEASAFPPLPGLETETPQPKNSVAVPTAITSEVHVQQTETPTVQWGENRLADVVKGTVKSKTFVNKDISNISSSAETTNSNLSKTEISSTNSNVHNNVTNTVPSNQQLTTGGNNSCNTNNNNNSSNSSINAGGSVTTQTTTTTGTTVSNIINNTTITCQHKPVSSSGQNVSTKTTIECKDAATSINSTTNCDLNASYLPNAALSPPVSPDKLVPSPLLAVKCNMADKSTKIDESLLNGELIESHNQQCPTTTNAATMTTVVTLETSSASSLSATVTTSATHSAAPRSNSPAIVSLTPLGSVVTTDSATLAQQPPRMSYAQVAQHHKERLTQRERCNSGGDQNQQSQTVKDKPPPPSSSSTTPTQSTSRIQDSRELRDSKEGVQQLQSRSGENRYSSNRNNNSGSTNSGGSTRNTYERTQSGGGPGRRRSGLDQRTQFREYLGQQRSPK